LHATHEVEEVYGLAANMGGVGFIETNKAVIVRDNTLMNLNTIEAARRNGVKRYLYTSSACIYPGYLQNGTDVAPLKESDAYPADAEDGYGWEKLYMERICRHYTEDFGLETRVVRFHNIFGPLGTYDGGREKAPAAICRKIIQAQLDGASEIEIWGDGEQTRSFTYIDDCIEGTLRLMQSDVIEPLNIGSDQLVTINELVDIVERIAGLRFQRRYRIDAPKGVRGRNSDNTLIQERLNWAPSVRLEDGMRRTYGWIRAEMTERGVGNRRIFAY
jgi:nucleoside-diphosphate-sugar epimerase